MGEIRRNIFAVDFDGTLCDDEYPEIGKANKDLIWFLTKARDCGEKIILWTCRTGELLKNAVEWCGEQGLEFDAVNENIPEMIERYGGDTRKVFADYYIDDKNYMPYPLNNEGR